MGKKQENKIKPEDEQVETRPQEDEAEDLPKLDNSDSAEPQEELCEEDKLKIQVAELEDKLLRAAAEFDNYRKRVARQYEDMVRSANDSMLMGLIEVVDNFERALNHGAEDTDFESFHKGTELIFHQMKDLLQKYDITPIDAVGQPFDPNLHEAMMQIDSDEYDDGIVAIEIARGYCQGSRVVRHSRVGVSSGRKQESDDQ